MTGAGEDNLVYAGGVATTLEAEDFQTFVFVDGGAGASTLLTGGSNGRVYAWAGGSVAMSFEAHAGPAAAIAASVT